jgi:hypothetical protein
MSPQHCKKCDVVLVEAERLSGYCAFCRPAGPETTGPPPWKFGDIPSQTAQRIAGGFLLVCGGWLLYFNWRTAINQGFYYEKSAFLGPMFAIAGLASIFFPIDRDEYFQTHGVVRPTRWTELPAEWMIVSVLAILGGLLNWYFISTLR